MNIEDLIEKNKESNRKVRQSIMIFNNYEQTVAEYEEEFGHGSKGKSMRRAKHNCPCPVCGTIMNFYTPPLEPKHPSIDHKHPKFLSRHLALDPVNFWIICQECNQEKGNKTWPAYEYWLESKYGSNSHQYRGAVANRPSKI